jgi:hypothetical protein
VDPGAPLAHPTDRIQAGRLRLAQARRRRGRPCFFHDGKANLAAARSCADCPPIKRLNVNRFCCLYANNSALRSRPSDAKRVCGRSNTTAGVSVAAAALLFVCALWIDTYC